MVRIIDITESLTLVLPQKLSSAIAYDNPMFTHGEKSSHNHLPMFKKHIFSVPNDFEPDQSPCDIAADNWI